MQGIAGMIGYQNFIRTPGIEISMIGTRRQPTRICRCDRYKMSLLLRPHPMKQFFFEPKKITAQRGAPTDMQDEIGLGGNIEAQ